MEEEIICKSCGSVNDYTSELKTNQLVCTCNGCGKYIKNKPYQPPKFYFGKLKGTLVSGCSDISYMEWMKKTDNNKRMKDALTKRIEELKKIK